MIADLLNVLKGRWKRRSPTPTPAPTFAFTPSTPPALRPTPPTLPYDLVEVLEALARLDAATPAEVAARSRFWGVAYHTTRGRSDAARGAMAAEPDTAWIFCDDPSGYLRETALRRLEAPPSSPGRLVMLVLRLNDWVPEVRLAAADAARRLLPETSAHVVAACAGLILRRRFEWARWSDEAAPLDETFGRAEVAEQLSTMLLEGEHGAPGRLLRNVLRFPAIDRHLPDLALHAKAAAVRAVALRTLTSGRAVWPVGYGREWVDKVYNRSRRIVVLDERPVAGLDTEVLVRKAVEDKSATVRKVAADAIWTLVGTMPDAKAIAIHLSNDRNAGVRERAGFILKRLSQEAIL